MRLTMNYSVVILILTGAVFTSADITSSEIHIILGCHSRDTEVYLAIDWEATFYLDFVKKEVVWTVPNSQPPPDFPFIYGFAIEPLMQCRALKEFEEGEPIEAEAKDAPVSSIYARDPIELGVENTLICFVNHFYPPSIKVSWTKNNMALTERVSFHPHYPNKDGTFHQFYSLSFTPEEGDVYTCTVEHMALEDPQTRIWEPKVDVPGVGPAVFCGVGLSLGLLGVAVGTFILVKQPE